MRRKIRSVTIWRIIIAFLLLCIVGMLGFLGYEWWILRKAKMIRYDAFGIEIPENYTIHGIDVSRYQQLIDWESVKAMAVSDIKIDFAFIKATEGVGNIDPFFKRNWKKSREAQMVRGAYHFFLATKSGKAQAENYIARVELQSGDLPPVLDVEQTYGVSGIKLRQRVKEWLSTVEAFYGVKPILYTNVDFYKQYLKSEFDDYPLWVAHYLQRDKPRIVRDWYFWQHSEDGRVNGILSKVDFNVFSGDSLAFSKLLLP
jgi:lysozyme